ncbi:ABC transporter permease (plasmid) [Agrobacterium tumefaciens]|nr:ABC transporter permease [Agrobacterium tumefaciens]QSZ60739.1 ABC transporter permease [Rhizobium sp. ZX09]CUX66287.1 ABC transporter permease protein; putative dipeptide transport protein [Agrobacterium genomosp. 5 str. CFBP 6626]
MRHHPYPFGKLHMLSYIFSRIVSVILLMLVMSAVIFVATTWLPGDPAVSILGVESSAEERAKVRETYGLDDPVPVQYVRWFGRVVEGDLGRSIRTREPVADMLAARAPVTLQLTVFALLVAMAIGIPAGICAARWRGRLADGIISTVALVASAVPFFWLGVILILFVAVRLHWLPASGYALLFDQPLESLKLMILPATAVGCSLAALITRQTRAAMLQVLNEDFVRTGRAKGLREDQVVLRHALPNALIPVITVVGLQAGALLGGAIVTEKVFAIAGIGSMVIDGIFNRDFPVIQGAMLFIVLCVALINLMVDLLYTLVNPRISYR